MPMLRVAELRMVAEVVGELRLEARRTTDRPRKLLARIAPLFRDLEREAEAVLSGCRASE